jgi:hypothetical protein
MDLIINLKEYSGTNSPIWDIGYMDEFEALVKELV